MWDQLKNGGSFTGYNGESMSAIGKWTANMHTWQYLVRSFKMSNGVALRASAMDVLVTVLVSEEGRKLPIASPMDWPNQ